MNSKKVTIISVVFALCLCLFGSLAVYAISVNGQKEKKKEDPKEFGMMDRMDDETHKLARIDNIEGNTVTVTFNAFERPELNQDPESTNPQENSKPTEHTETESEQQKLTVKDTALLDGVTVGSEVMLELDPNDPSIITNIETDGPNKGMGKFDHTVGRIDSLNGEQVTVTLGELSKPAEPAENTEQENKPSNNFTAGTETKTYTVKDVNLLTDLKVGDIVDLEVSQSDENILDGINLVDDMFKNKPDSSKQGELPQDKQPSSNTQNNSGSSRKTDQNSGNMNTNI